MYARHSFASVRSERSSGGTRIRYVRFQTLGVRRRGLLQVWGKAGRGWK